MPIVMASQSIKEIAVGQVLEVLSTDPAAGPDFQAWSKMTGHKLVSLREEAGPPVVYCFLLQRTA